MNLETGTDIARARKVCKEAGSTGPVWICDPGRTVMGHGLARNLSERIPVHFGWEGPPHRVRPTSVVLCCVDAERLPEDLEHVRLREREAYILIFNPYMDLQIAWNALRLGARGYLHAGMRPDQILRAISAAEEGEIVAPRKLLEYVVENTVRHCPDMLSARRREILDLVADGLTNAQIAHKLFLSESTVKQHLYAAYKILGVRNRTEAASLVRNGGGQTGLG